MNKRLVSGIQPTGQLHIGNYLGAIKQWIDFQHDYDCFFSVVDYHGLTLKPKPNELRDQTLQTLAMLIALGIDPDSSNLFVQSQIPEHSELNWLLSPFVTVGQLNRMTQFKEKSDRHGQNIGLLTYPILMAADIIIYDAAVVPVGDDQIQHLELGREIVRSFNAHAGPVFTEPKPLLSHAPRIMSLSNPEKKMSKSIPGSSIGLLDDEDTIARTFKRAVTDSDPNTATISPPLKNLLDILTGFAGPDLAESFKTKRLNGNLQYSELKEALVEEVTAFLRPVQKTYQNLITNPENLTKLAERGAQKARPIAQAKVLKVKEALGLV